MPATDLRRSVKIAKLSPEAQDAARKLKLDDNQDALLEAAKAKTPGAQTAVIQQRAAQETPKKKRAPSARQVDQDAAALQSVWKLGRVRSAS